MSTSPPPGLIDSFGRRHSNLRLSVTDRCNIRCFYCMPEENPAYAPKSDILSYEEILRFAAVAASLGVDKVRLTGGEPLVRRDLPVLIAGLRAIDGIRDIALTTNGLLLGEQAQALRDAGLGRLNIHLDTLDRERFRTITRRDELPRVLAGIDAAEKAGFAPIKLNAVAVRGLIEEDIGPLLRYGRERGFEVRFIEFMPLDADGRWQRDRVLPAAEILEAARREIGPAEEVPGGDARDPAVAYRFTDGRGGFGVIASVTRPFCHACNRIRLTADGKLRNCLFALSELDISSILRGGADPGAVDMEIAATIRRSVGAKWEGHEINQARFEQPQRPMYAIGG